jgi:hypothetical protein
MKVRAIEPNVETSALLPGAQFVELSADPPRRRGTG